MLAPVAIFVYARPGHTARTLEALARCPEAQNTTVYCFSDAPKSEEARSMVEATRSVVMDYAPRFKKIVIERRTCNFGLAKNIINGVGKVVESYGRVIVLEDDLEVADTFLQYMNAALDLYEHAPKVGAVSGFSFIQYPYAPTYFLRLPMCWGWATWHDRWQLFNREAWLQLRGLEPGLRRYLNFNGANDFAKQYYMNRAGSLQTWFIFWYLALAHKGLLTVFPAKSLVVNIGLDGTGENCRETDLFSVELGEFSGKFDAAEIRESELAVALQEQYYIERRSLARRLQFYVLRALRSCSNKKYFGS